MMTMSREKQTYSRRNKSWRKKRQKVNQAESFFREAIVHMNNGDLKKAREIGREAMFHARFHSPKLLIDCHGLLATIHMDMGKYDIARIHCWEALELLSPSDYRYGEDYEYFKNPATQNRPG